MTVYINSDDQKQVDQLRITLTQVIIDMTEVFTHDDNSHRKKTEVLQQLSDMRKTMDVIGLTHTVARKIDNIRTSQSRDEYLKAAP